jgi:hypothetical protein
VTVAIDSIPGKLDALTERVGSLEVRQHEIAAAVDENTRITRQIEQHTGLLAEHTGALVEMVRTYGEVKTATKVAKAGFDATAWIVAKVAVIGGAIAAAWHWLAPK